MDHGTWSMEQKIPNPHFMLYIMCSMFYALSDSASDSFIDYTTFFNRKLVETIFSVNNNLDASFFESLWRDSFEFSVVSGDDDGN